MVSWLGSTLDWGIGRRRYCVILGIRRSMEFQVFHMGCGIPSAVIIVKFINDRRNNSDNSRRAL